MVFDPDYIVDITLAIADAMRAYSPMHQQCEPLTAYSSEIRAAVRCVLKYDDIEKREYMQ